MTRTQIPACSLVFPAVFLMLGVGCNRRGVSDDTAKLTTPTRPIPNGTAIDERPAYTVNRLPPSRRVRMDDRSLAKWTEALKVMEIPQDRASALRWSAIRGQDPVSVAHGHFGIKVYMAWDDQYWYVAINVLDDAVRSVLPSSLSPYNGDCFELYFAGTNIDSEKDIHDLVLAGPPARRSDFQLDMPPTDLDTPGAHFADWRTDFSFKQQALGQGFAAHAWKKEHGWSAEARIPLAAFEASVRDRITTGEPLRAALTYLDYNKETGSGASWAGFEPDNVFCLDAEERQVNVPRYMRRILFKRD